jgi:hypothetical protein
MKEPGIELICRRCCALMRLAREIPGLGTKARPIRVFVCTDCGEVQMIEGPQPVPL